MFSRWLRPTASERLWSLVGALFLLLVVVQMIVGFVRSTWPLLLVLLVVVTGLITGGVYLWERRNKEPYYW